MLESYCMLTGDKCPHIPKIAIVHYGFFISEPYDNQRSEREKSIKEAIKGYKFVISDHEKSNISITCKICRQIQSAQFGIVDISNYNRNVLIELGMLFGFNKPVLILLKRPKPNVLKRLNKSQIEIPSNILGIEQIRYSSFPELTKKLKEALNFLLEISKKQAEYVLDVEQILRSQIQNLELTILSKKIRASNIDGEVQFYNYIAETPIFIVNKGSNEGFKENMILSVIKITVDKHQNLEEEMGRLIIKHIQPTLSQCEIVLTNPNSQQFWLDLTNKRKKSKNIVRPYLNERFVRSDEQDLTIYASKLKILLQGLNTVVM